ncbi:MAG: hypothetical protein R3B72_11910 [Polyangiaceae bacterium]
MASAAPAASLSVPPAAGVEACRHYFEAATSCFPSASPELRRSLQESMDRYRGQLEQATTDAAKEVVAIGCEAAAEALAEEPGCKAP